MSKIKRNIPINIIEDLFKKHCNNQITSIKELNGGTFNLVYKIETKGSDAFIIKIAPDSNTEVLTYEKNIINNELRFYELMSDAKSIHLPKIYGYDTGENSRYKYIIMEFIEGDMLNKAKLSKEEYSAVMYNLGIAMAEIHSIIKENSFGYMQTLSYSTFKQAYKSMTDNVINDGLKMTKTLPCLSEIRTAIDKHSDAFNALKESHLVHFDLWPGNLIIKNKELYAIIDCERCMLGDPIGDFISLDYVAPVSKAVPEELIKGYNDYAENKLTFNKNELRRFYLMRLYLGLIVYTETYYRCTKYSPEFIGRLIFGKAVIQNALKELDKI